MGISERIELRHFRAFLAVAEELNFRVAAERLHLTQPPLTRTIRQLEDILGAPLFRRNTRSCELTDFGARILPPVRKILSLVKEELLLLREQGQPSVLRVGVCFAIHAVKLPIMREVIRQATSIPVDLDLRMSHDLVQAMIRGSLDVAVVLAPLDVQDLHSLPVARAEMMVALPSKHPLATQRVISPKDLNAFRRILLPSRRENPAMFTHITSALARCGVSAPQYVHARDAFEGLGQIAAGAACSLLCETLKGHTGDDVVLRPIRKLDRIVAEFHLLVAPTVPVGTVGSVHRAMYHFLSQTFALRMEYASPPP